MLLLQQTSAPDTENSQNLVGEYSTASVLSCYHTCVSDLDYSGLFKNHILFWATCKYWTLFKL